jgi:hypothetical protein
MKAAQDRSEHDATRERWSERERRRKRQNGEAMRRA